MDIETLTLDELIKTLQTIKEDLTKTGIENASKVKVFLSSDEEGNSFGTLANKQGYFSFEFLPNRDSNYGDALIIYPFEEHINLLNF